MIANDVISYLLCYLISLICYMPVCVMVYLFSLYRDRDGVFVDEVVSIVV